MLVLFIGRMWQNTEALVAEKPVNRVWQFFLAIAGGCSAGLYARRPLAAATRMRRG